jgi:hypothetical protein
MPGAAIFADNNNIATAVYRFDALYDAFNITELTFNISNVTAVELVYLTEFSGNSIATMSGVTTTTLTFDGISIPIAADSHTEIAVRLVLSSVGVGAGTSGSAVTTDFNNGKAIPASTGVEAAITDNTTTGNAMYVYKAVPSITKVTHYDRQLRNEEEVLLKFAISSIGDDISWTRLFFDVTKDALTSLATSTTYLYDVTGGGQTLVAGTFTGTNYGASASAATLEFDATAETFVSGTKTYELRATVSAANADFDYITTELDPYGTYVAPTSSTGVETADSDAFIIWSDMSVASHGTSTLDWASGYKILSSPTQNSLNW